MSGEIKAGVIGLGGRGLSMLKHVFLKMDDIEVTAVCDLYADRIKAGADDVEKASGVRPFETADYKKLLECDLDAVFIMAAWEAHIKVAIEAMERGIYVAMEVGGAYRIEDCFDLVKTYESTKIPCMLLENCCYNNRELAVLNAVRQGLFGEVVHCSGGYLHDLRGEIAFGRENRHYRLNNYLNRNCENYPTHELGPIAKVLNINRGNRMTSLISVSSKAAGLHQFMIDKKPDDKELCNASFEQGDIVTTVIGCAGGETIVLTLDTTLPRPYGRGFTVRGTKAMYTEEGDFVFIDGKHDKLHMLVKLLWGNGRRFVKKYAHPITKLKTKSALHGSMDWRVVRAFVDAVKLKENTPIDAYDTASWMAVTALSEKSIAEGGIKVDFPDFTSGRWADKGEKLKNAYSLD